MESSSFCLRSSSATVTMSTAWPASDEPQHGGVDAAVRVEREVVGDEQHGGVGDRQRLDQHGAENGRLGMDGCGALLLIADELGNAAMNSLP